MNHALVYRQKNKTSKVINHHNYRQSAEQNNAVKQLLTRHRIQPKLKISRPDDPLEREADEMADRVMGMSDAQAAKRSVVQTKSENSTNSQYTTRLPDKLKNGIEFLSGYPMDDVKVHYNSPHPAKFDAHAFARGSDIHLASGAEKYLPHEAWHVVQQKQGRVLTARQLEGKDLHVRERDSSQNRSRLPSNIVRNKIKVRRKKILLRAKRESETESQKESKWSAISPAYLWGPERISPAKAKKGWRTSTKIKLMGRTHSFGWLLYNFEVGKSDLSEKKQFSKQLKKLLNQLKVFNKFNINGDYVFGRTYIGIYGHHSKSGGQDINNSIAFSRAYNVWNWMRRKYTIYGVTYFDPKAIQSEPIGILTSKALLEGSKWEKDQFSVRKRSINRSVIVFVFFKEKHSRRFWRNQSIKILKKSNKDYSNFGIWILNNWGYFMDPSKSSKAWVHRGGKYGLFFYPPSDRQLIDTNIKELKPNMAIDYFHSLYRSYFDDVNKLARRTTLKLGSDCDAYSCLPASISDSNQRLKNKKTCQIRFCRYETLKKEASKGSVFPIEIKTLEWGVTVCDKCMNGYIRTTCKAMNLPNPCK